MSQFQLGKKVREPVKWGWEKEAGIIIFHIVNVHTRVAQFEGIAGEKNHNVPYESTSPKQNTYKQ